MTTERRMITIDERTLDGSVNAVAKLTDRVIALEEKLAAAERDRHELAGRCVMLEMDRDAHAAMADQLAAARQRIAGLERDYTGMANAYDRSVAKNHGLNAQLEAALSEIDRLRNELTMARAAYESERDKEHDL